MSFWTESNRDAYSVAVNMAATPISERSFSRSFELANDISIYALLGIALAVMVGMVLARATTILARERLVGMRSDPALALIGLASNLSIIALLATALLQTRWYWPLIIFVLGTLGSGLLINRKNSVRLYKLSPLLGLSVIVATAVLLWSIWK